MIFLVKVLICPEKTPALVSIAAPGDSSQISMLGQASSLYRHLLKDTLQDVVTNISKAVRSAA